MYIFFLTLALTYSPSCLENDLTCLLCFDPTNAHLHAVRVCPQVSVVMSARRVSMVTPQQESAGPATATVTSMSVWREAAIVAVASV